MQKFKPIYIYTQSLDNSSQDLMYKISRQDNAIIEQITDLSVAQSIMSDMHAVAKDKNIKNYFADVSAKFIKEHIKSEKDFLIYSQDAKIFIKIKTDDKDNLGRHSPIHVLLDLSGLSSDDVSAYADYFQSGFVQFCQMTGRNPKNPELIRTLPFLYSSNIDKDERPSNKKVSLIIAIVVVAIVLMIVNSYIN